MTQTAPIDAVTAAVIRSAMETICFEMATYVSRTATTPILNQSNERNATEPTDVAAAVAEFHRINAEARLIEARAEEPLLRGVRLTATGHVDRPVDTELPVATSAQPGGYRRTWIDGWHDAVPLYEMDAVLPGVLITGRAPILSAVMSLT